MIVRNHVPLSAVYTSVITVFLANVAHSLIVLMAANHSSVQHDIRVCYSFSSVLGFFKFQVGFEFGGIPCRKSVSQTQTSLIRIHKGDRNTVEFGQTQVSDKPRRPCYATSANNG